jgi:hypothetical protein
MNDRSWVVGLVVAAATLAGCGMSKSAKDAAAFDEYGYRNNRFGYRVLQSPNANNSLTHGLMDDAWLFDNLYEKKTRSGKGVDLKPKDTAEYVTTFAFDTDGDGRDDRREKNFVYDLRFKHRQRDAVIFLRTLPIGGDLKDRDLRVLVQNYIDGVSGAGYEAAQVRGHDVVTEQRFAAELRERGEATLAGQPAYQATFDVANVDQLRVSPTARHTRVRVVFARAPFVYTLEKHAGATQTVSYPVLVVAGYGSLPEDFDKDLPAFTGLLQRVQFGSTVGYAAKAPEILTPAQPQGTAPPATNAAAPAPIAPAASAAAAPSVPSAAAP